jgi:hypothetical protein
MTKKSKTLLKKLFSIYFAFSLTFSHLSPFFLFASQVQASQADSTQESLQQPDSVVFNSESHSLELSFPQDSPDANYELHYDTGVIIDAAVGETSSDSASIFLGTKSTDDSTKAFPERAILKVQSAGSDTVFSSQLEIEYPENQSNVEVPVVSYESSDMALSTSETMWLSGGVHRVKNINTDVTYEFPLNKLVSVTFTQLPETLPTEGVLLAMKEVQLTEEQVTELGAASAIAYEITSNMDNGTFKYDLTLPNPVTEGEVAVKYSEDGENFEETQGEELVTEEKDGNDLVRITGLDHFTVFVVVLDTAPEVFPPSFLSLGFQATSTSEFGDHYILDGDSRNLEEIEFSLTTWACENDYDLVEGVWVINRLSSEPCTKTDGSSFTHPITINIYEADSESSTGVGTLITSKTEEVIIPFRPESNEVECGDLRWYDEESESCNNGFAFTESFDFSAENITLPDEVIVSFAYNTGTWGYSPIGAVGPYNSLNVSLTQDDPYVGEKGTPGQSFVYSNNNTYYGDAGPKNVFRKAPYLGGYSPILEIKTSVPDVTAPTFEIISPADNAYLGSNIHRIIAKVSDPSGIFKVLFNLSGNTASYEEGKTNNSLQLVEGTEDEFYIDFDMSVLSEGPQYIVLRGTDKEGNTRYWNNNANARQHVFYIDNTPPNTYFQLQPPAVVNDTMKVRLRAQGEADGTTIDKYIYFNSEDPENLCYSRNSVHRNLDANCDVSGLSEGVHTLFGVAIDQAGNRAEVVSNSFIVDRTGPTITVKDSSIGDSADAIFSKVDFKLFDSNKVDKVELNGQLKDLTNDNWSDFNTVKPGSFGAVEGLNTLVAFDVAGNISTYEFTLDTVEPAAPDLISPENNAIVNGSSVTQEWSESDDDVVSYVYESYNDSEADDLRWNESFTTTSKTATNVSETTYWWRVKAVDQAGNESDWSDLWKLTVDNTAPQISYVSPTSGEYYADDVNIEVEVTEENPHQYQFRIIGMVDGTPTGQFYSTGWVTVDETFDGTFNHIWDSTTAPYGDGQYRLDFDFRDKAGNQVEKNLIFYVDNGNPTIPQDVTVIPTSPTNQTSQTWSWTASTDIGGSGILGYWTSIYDVINDTVFQPAIYVGNVTSFGTNLTEGIWNFFVYAEDNVGNISDSAESSEYEVDTTPPVVSITSHSDGDVLTGTENILGSIEEKNPGLYNIALYEGHDESTTWNFANREWQEQVNGSNSVDHTINTNDYPDGEYMIRLAARDQAGNRDPMANSGSGSSVEIVKVIIDNSGPEISNINMLVNGVPSTLVKPGDIVRISAVITDEYSNVDLVRIIARQRPNTEDTILFPNQTMLLDPEAADTFFYEFTVPATYTSGVDLNQALNGNFYRIRAWDEHDNQRQTGTENRFTIDNTLPESTITGPGEVSPDDETTIYVDEWNGSVFGEATDTAPGQVAGVEIEIARTIETVTTYWNGSEWSTDASSRVQAQSSDDFATWTYQIPAPFSDELTSGTYTVTSRAYDMAGNKENSAKLIIVLDREIPEVNISVNPTEPDGDNNWYETRPTVTLTEGESFSGIKEIQYSWNNETGPWTTYSSPFQIPGEGSYVLYYRAINNADVASATGAKNLRWDETDLEEGPLNVSANPSRTSGTTSTISWDAAEDNIGIDRYEIVWRLRDGDLEFSKTVSSSTRETEIDRMTEEGEWEVVVRAYDQVGNREDGSTRVTVIQTAPAAPTLTLAGTAVGSANLTWNAVENASRYIVYYGVNPGEYIFAASVGNTTDYTVQGLAADTYYFMVRAVDDVDNQSSNSNEVSTGALAGAPGTTPGAGGTTPAEGFDDAGDVLGDDDDAESVELDEDGNPINQDGEVAGAIDENCNTVQQYLPWILLAVLSVGAVALELLLKRHTGLAKMGAAIGLLVVILGTHYVFNNPDCFVTGSITNIVNSWFIVFAAVLAGLARLAGFAFIEEVEI